MKRTSTRAFFSLLVGLIAGCLSVVPRATRAQGSSQGLVADSTELRVLRAFYQSTGGPQWSNRTGWPTTEADWAQATIAQAANWYGLGVSNGDVSSLYIVNNNLQGSLPASFGKLQGLTSITFGLCRGLTGPLPASMGQLSRLTFLRATITNLGGPLPVELSRLTQLQVLWLTDNLFSGSLPVWLGSFSSLTYLDLQTNRFTGTIPAELGNLSQLTYLGLDNYYNIQPGQGNQLTGGIPPALGKLQNLTSLLLDMNPLGGPIPKELGQLKKLQFLELDENRLTGKVPAEVLALPQLNTLLLSNPSNLYYHDHNQLTGLPDPGVIANPANLRLQVSDNQLDFGALEPYYSSPGQWRTAASSLFTPQNPLIPAADTLSPAVAASLTLHGNLGGQRTHYQWQRRRSGQWQDLGGAQDSVLTLASVSVADSGAYRVRATNDWVTGLTLYSRTHYVQVHSSDEGQVPDATELRALHQLFVSTNGSSWSRHDNWPLTDTAWSQATLAQAAGWYGVNVTQGDVQGLYLSNNYVTGQLPPAIGLLTELRYFYLERYRFAYDLASLGGTLPKELGNLHHLQTLVIQFNNLGGSIPAELGKLSELRDLELENNNLSGPIPPELGKLTQLQTLLLDNYYRGGIYGYVNHFSGGIPRELGRLTQLTTLSLGNSPLGGTIPVELGNLTKLSYLDLDDAGLTGAVPASVLALPNLQALYLNGFGLGVHPVGQAYASTLSQLPSPQVIPNPSSLKLVLGSNQLDFGQLEPYFTAPGQLLTGPGSSYLPQSQPVLAPDTLQPVANAAVTLDGTLAGTRNHYQWQRLVGGQWLDLPGQTQAQLSWPRATPAQTGRYRTHVTNELVTGLTLYSRVHLLDVLPYSPLARNLPDDTNTGLALLTPHQPADSASAKPVDMNYVRTWIPRVPLTKASDVGSPAPAAQAAPTGYILRERWDHVGGTLVSQIPVDSLPSSFAYLTALEGPLNEGDEYGARLRGYLSPPQTGVYRFWLAGDDQCELWLSTDDTPARKVKIAQVSGYTDPRQWDKAAEQHSDTIRLVAGRRYYLEVLHKEGGGGDHVSVAWTLPSQTFEGPIAGKYLSPASPLQQAASTQARVLREEWAPVGGSLLSELPITTPPTSQGYLPTLEGPVNKGIEYGARLRTFVMAPRTGQYVFYLAGDDQCELWVSPDENPSHKVKRAQVSSYTDPREWYKAAEQRSDSVRLVAGQRYYVEVLHKQGGGGDNVAVAWTLPGGAFEGPIAGDHLSPFSLPQPGLVLREQWNQLGGADIATIPLASPPASTGYVATLEVAPVPGLGDEYGARLSAYLTAPQTGNYTFWVAGDDAAELWLSTDADTSHLQRLAYTSRVTGFRQYDADASQHSTPVPLAAGQRYYVRVLHKQQGGGDHVSVAWQLPDNSRETPIASSHFAPAGPPPGGSAVRADTVLTPVALVNPGFEADSSFTRDPQGWTATPGAGTAGSAAFVESSHGAHSGTYYGVQYAEQPYEITTSQTVTNLASGRYTLRAWVRTNDGNVNSELRVSGYGGAQQVVSMPSGSQDWQQLELRDLPVSSGQLQLSFYSNAPGGHALYYDDISLARQGVAATQQGDEPVWTVDQASKTTQYLDGLGRPVQTVQHQASPQRHDLVQVQAYDGLGREPRAYLPFAADTAGTGSLGYHGQPLTRQQRFYGVNPAAGPASPQDLTAGVARTGVAYAETSFEASPLNRVLAQGAPGEAGQVTSTDGHFSQRLERPNTAADSVLYFKPGYDPTSLDPGYQGFYAPGELWGTQVSEPHQGTAPGELGYASMEWKDKLGQVVLKQVEAARTGSVSTGLRSRWLRTAYVYDDFQRLRFVVQPEGVNRLLAPPTPATPLDPLTQGLQVWLPLDETSGSQATNAANANLAGTLGGNPAGATWLPTGGHDGGGALSLTQGTYLDIPLSWQPSAFTVSFWLKPLRQFDYSQITGAVTGWGAFLFHSTAVGSLYVGTDVDTRLYLPNTRVVTPGVWQHFVFTYDNGLGQLYKDGVLLATRSDMSPSQPWGGLRLGSSGDESYDEVRVYNRALSLAQVQTLTTGTAGTYHPPTAGLVERQQWTGFYRGDPLTLPLTQTPVSTTYLPSLEGPANQFIEYADRLRGYLVAPQTGAYRFWLASDDQGEFYLSRDATPARIRRLARVPNYGSTNPRQWDKYAEQQSDTVQLVAGQRYYFETRHSQLAGNDYLGVTWRWPDGTHYGEPIEGAYLLPYSVPPVGQDLPARPVSAVRDYLFHYRYDGRGRQIAKQVPGQDGETLVVYDQLDRPVLSQDAQQRTRKEWSWTKYDALGRVVLTGLVTRPDGLNQEGLQNLATADTATVHQYEQRTADATYDQHYTTGQSFPQLNQNGFGPGLVLTASYYDDYDFDNDGQPDADGHYTSVADAAFAVGQAPVADEARVTGMPTRTMTRVLNRPQGEPGAEWLKATMFYDERGRVIQTQSQNARGGQDVVTLQLDFLGKPVRSVARHMGPLLREPLQVVETMRYDHAERLLATYQQLPGEMKPAPISRRAYNELGQLLVDSLASGRLAQNVKYAYNIRGWLTSLNNPYQPAPQDLFNLSLHYETGFTKGYEQYNGNLTGQTWRGRDGVQRAYGYAYDPLNRLLQGDFVARTTTANPSTGAWQRELDRYRLSFVSYDDNGNINTLRRQGLLQAATSKRAAVYGAVDNLIYAYQGNRLQSVDDQVTGNQLPQPASYHGAPTSLAGDFQEAGVHQGQEYRYDAAGNLTQDLNKGITGILYNHLNLPRQIHFGQGADSVVFRYTAAGQKVAKLVYQTGKQTPTRTDYLGPYQYEQDSLKFFPHAAGRVLRFVSQDPAGQVTVRYQREYTIKDHLGNLRLAYRAGQVRRLLATLEQDADTRKRETQQFDSLSVSAPIATNTTLTHSGQYAAKLNAGGSAPQPLGPLTQLGVQKGDTVRVQAFGYYQQPVQHGFMFSLASFIANLFHPAQAPPPGLEAQKRKGFPILQVGVAAGLASIPQLSGGVPKGYLRVLVFNKDSALVRQRTWQLSQTAAGGFEQLGDTVRVSQDGYVTVYVGNESDVDVLFDDVEVEHRQGLQIQENQYDPWGISLAGLDYSSPSLLQMNQYQFNGKEQERELGLNWQDFNWRHYDPAMARFFGIDRLADKFVYMTDYQFASNNPASKIELDGLEGVPINPQQMALGQAQQAYEQVKNKVSDAVTATKEALTPSTRTALALTGATNLMFGVLGTAGAIAALPETGLASGLAIPFTTGEAAIGLTQITDALGNSNVSDDSPIQQSSSIPGLVAYGVGYENAPYVDAVSQFLPGMMSGGNINSVLGGPKAIREASGAVKKTVEVLNLADAGLDTYGLGAATVPIVRAAVGNTNAISPNHNNTSRHSSPIQFSGEKLSSNQVNQLTKFVNSLPH